MWKQAPFEARFRRKKTPSLDSLSLIFHHMNMTINVAIKFAETMMMDEGDGDFIILGAVDIMGGSIGCAGSSWRPGRKKVDKL